MRDRPTCGVIGHAVERDNASIAACHTQFGIPQLDPRLSLIAGSCVRSSYLSALALSPGKSVHASTRPFAAGAGGIEGPTPLR